MLLSRNGLGLQVDGSVSPVTLFLGSAEPPRADDMQSE